MVFSSIVEVVRFLKTLGKERGRPSDDCAYLSSHPMKGRVRTGSLFLFLLLAVGVILGVQALSAYANYLSLADTVRLVVQDVTLSPQRVAEGEERILAKARELELPVAEHQVVLTVEAEKISARVRWRQPIGLWGYTIPLTFEINESRSL